MPTGRIKKYIPFGIGHSTLGLVIILLLTGNIGLWALVIKNFLIPVLLSVILFLFFRKEVNLKLYKENILLITYSIIGAFLIYLLSGNISIIISVILSTALYFFMKSEEKMFVKNKILKANIFKRKN